MASPEQQRRTAEITRVLAANGWGATSIRDVDSTVVVQVQKPTAAIPRETLQLLLQSLRILVEQFRWEVTDYNAGDVFHVATLRLR